MGSWLPASTLVLLTLLVSIRGDFEPSLSHCCSLGTKWGAENLKCAAFPAPVVGISNEQQTICLSAVHICCLRKHRDRQCDLGKQSARADRECSVTRELGGESHKDCCEGCKLGLVAGSMSMSCSFRAFQFGAPWDEAYATCCKQALQPQAPQTIPTALPQPRLNTDEDEDLCARFPGELCAHVCVPTPGSSYRCECREGFELLADGKSCQQTAQLDRCAHNNPCDQKCTDTGLAVECSCHFGYELANDQRTCIDIDECALGVDTCDLLLEVCTNQAGGYLCAERSTDAATNSSIANLGRSTDDNRCPKGFKFNAESRVCDDIDECSVRPSPCELPLVCQNTIGSFSCVQKPIQDCPLGFRFSQQILNCVDIDECIEQPDICPRNRPVCVNVQGSYTCQLTRDETSALGPTVTCPAGYKFNNALQTCEDIDECAEGLHNCSRQTQSCVNGIGDFRCVDREPDCGFGFRYDPNIRRCADINECAEGKDYCNVETEVCVNDQGGYRCTPKTPEAPRTTTPPTTTRSSRIPCPRGYRFNDDSRRCMDINECVEANPCRSSQQCENTVGSYVCRCGIGFRFNAATQNCEDVNECLLDLHDCVTTQRCDNTIGSYTCVRTTSCGTGYTFNAETVMCEDDDECLMDTHDCHRLGPQWQCRNTEGSYRCERKRCESGQVLNENGECLNIECAPGFEPDPRGRCNDIDECARNDPCPRAHRCINTVGSFQCTSILKCDSGFGPNESATECVDIDECSSGTHDCRQNQICQNRPGGFTCLCPQGYTVGADRQCQDIDECTRFAGQICSSSATCVNTPGSYRCQCKDGFRSGTDSRSCVDIDECSETARLCQHTCANTWGSFVCSCRTGYTLAADGRSCQDVDECEQYRERGGLCVGICVNEPGSYSCKCPEGYRLNADNRTCQDIDECATPNVCRSEETCLNTRGGYYCNAVVCPPNYVRDQDHRNRCKRVSLECHSWDAECLRKPVSYSYNFLTLPSKMAIPRSGHLDLFSMRGPLWPTASVQFALELDEARAGPGINPVTRNYFTLRRSAHNQAVLALARSIPGPQDIELQLNMEMFQNGVFSGVAVVKIYIYVTRYEF